MLRLEGDQIYIRFEFGACMKREICEVLLQSFSESYTSIL